MPVEGLYKYQDGEIDPIPLMRPINGGTFYSLDYENGKLKNVVGVDFYPGDVGGTVHYVEDEELIDSFCAANAPDFFTTENQISHLRPNHSLIVASHDRAGRLRYLILKHTVQKPVL